MSVLRPYAGRVIFDHLPKTAGQAVNAWLQVMLGAGCVTTNLIGNHRELISRYGGEYPVISAHVAFHGEGLDSRYQYVSCFREPLDRAVSWLFYLIQQRDEIGLQKEYTFAQQFVDCEGRCEVPAAFLSSVSNPYVEHFSAIEGPSAATDSEKLARALAAIERYDIWGLHEAFSDFLTDFAGLLGLPAPGSIDRVNVTRERPAADRITPAFRQRLEELNALDIEFYRILQGRYGEARRRWQRPALSEPQWIPFERPAERIYSAPEFVLLDVVLEGAPNRAAGSLLSFCVEFSLARAMPELEIGIHIFDEDGCWAFGTNTTMLGQPLTDVSAGTHRLRYAVVAELPEGEYTAGFAFAERGAGGQTREIAWYDKLLGFRIALVRVTPSVGYVSLPVAVDCQLVSERVVQVVADGHGRIVFHAGLGELVVGETVSLPLTLFNESSQDWRGLWGSPVNLTYRWLDEQGQAVVADGLRTPLPEGGLMMERNIATSIVVKAPDCAGCYRLQVLPVQEMVCWFDGIGFEPAELVVNVLAVNARRQYEAGDGRLLSQVGERRDGSLWSAGREGFLIFGPYAAFPAGRYTARVDGCFPQVVSGVWLDVACEKGGRVLAKADWREMATDSTQFACSFELTVPASDLEVRLWVPASASIRVDRLVIEPQTHPVLSEIPSVLDAIKPMEMDAALAPNSTSMRKRRSNAASRKKSKK